MKKFRYVGTLESEDVGKCYVIRKCLCNCPQCSGIEIFNVDGAIGRVQEIDIGKKFYVLYSPYHRAQQIVQVENDEQRDKRLEMGKRLRKTEEFKI